MGSEGIEGIEQALDALTDNHEQTSRPTLSCDTVGNAKTIRSRSGQNGMRVRSPSSPSGRTGVPRSLDYMSPLVHNSGKNPFEYTLAKGIKNDEEAPPDPYRRRFHSADTDFRSALDYDDPGQREKEREAAERIKRARRHETWLDRENWNPRKWLVNLEDRTPGTLHEEPSASGAELEHTRSASPPPPPPPPKLILSRSLSQPQSPKAQRIQAVGWIKLRSIFPHITGSAQTTQQNPASSVAGKSVNITDELITGGLSGLVLGMWFERDDHGTRRIPVLLHRLRIRVSDSLYPLHSTKTVFRIEVRFVSSHAMIF